MHDNTFTMIENIAHLMVFENYKKVFILNGQKFIRNAKILTFF